MDIKFQGTRYELAERYTDMTKILFLCLFYSSIFPAGFFLCALSLTAKYFVDRFSLVRTWKRAPAVGPIISGMSRKYFLSLSVGIMAIICSYYWTGFSFDNLCLEGPVNDTYVGTFTVSYPGPQTSSVVQGGVSLGEKAGDLIKEKLGSKTDDLIEEDITITDDDLNYEFCDMDFKGLIPEGRFPYIPAFNKDASAYMNTDQYISTTYFGWTAFILMIVILVKFALVFYFGLKKTYGAGYEAVGESQGIPFSEVPSRSAYIPQVVSDCFAFPLIACKVDGIDEEVFDFTDPDRSYKYYDLTKDAKKLLAEQKIEDPPGFSIVKTWAPESDD